MLLNYNRLMKKLINLPSIKSDDDEKVPRKKSKTTSNNHLILEISLKLITKVIDLLIKNLNTILHSKATENTSHELIEENNKMNWELINLSELLVDFKTTLTELKARMQKLEGIKKSVKPSKI